MTDNHDPNGAYSEVFEEGKDSQQSQNIHRIRANSSIMQLKKILVANRGEIPIRVCALLCGVAMSKLLISAFDSLDLPYCPRTFTPDRRSLQVPIGKLAMHTRG
ncbi:pyruvate carboxylase [Cadophora gregata f. sp. sojae]|nr:pyruvate carboxylase [Cadophora gregata f. sp. sojae]